MLLSKHHEIQKYDSGLSYKTIFADLFSLKIPSIP